MDVWFGTMGLLSGLPWPGALVSYWPNWVLIGVKLVVKVVIGCICHTVGENPVGAEAGV
jgi:hypothetical protein